MIFPPILLRIAGLPASTLSALNCLWKKNNLLSEEEWNKLYFTTVIELCQLSKNKQLLNGLQMTSHSLAERVQKIIKQLPPTLRKKEQQTARSLWQIVSRMAGKTSPFSSFTHLGQENDQEENPGVVDHRFRLNNILLGQLLELLRYHPPYFIKQKISLNYTAQQDGAEFLFLHNTRNVESVQRIENQPVINLIITFLKDKKSILFQELVEVIQAEVDATKREITDYIFTLTEYGLLVWELPIAPSADNWWEPLAANLRQFSEDPFCQNLEKILTVAGNILPEIENQTPTERGQTQQHYFTLFKNLWEENKHRIPLLNSEEVRAEGLKQITDTDFLLKPETVFYEDTRLGVKDFWSENNWKPLREKMATLSRFLLPLTPSNTQDRLIDFYQKNFNQSISLWAFYQKWLRAAQATPNAENTQNSEIALSLNNRVATLPRSASLIHLTPEFLRSLSPHLGPSQNFGSLVLPFQNAGKDQLFLDTFVSANARLAGRFLPLFSEVETAAWRVFHQRQATDKRWIENQDYSFFNANVHPPLLPASLQIPALSIAGIDDGIPITELMVQMDKENSQLMLSYKNQIVQILNLSLEATDNRSGLYQLLCQFEPVVPSKNILLRAINELTSPSEQGVVKYPRVVYDQQIILQRSTWFFPKENLPFKAKGATTIAYQNLLLNWQKANHLPTQFYYTLNFDHRTTGLNIPRNEHKPQFFDIRNPLSIDLWHRDLKKVAHYLKIEEMLPLPEQLIEVDGVKRMVEALVVV